jgi:hypothetical protein
MKRILFLLICISFTVVASGQNAKNKLQAQRVAFITQRLNLTPEEAQQFWPVFNQYTEKLQQIRSSAKEEKAVDELSDTDTEKMILSEFDRESRELDLKKDLYQKLRKIISVKKIAKLYRAERDFKGMLIEKFQQNKEKRNQMRQNGN